MSGESGSVDYSGRLAQLRARIQKNRSTESVCPTKSSNLMKERCMEMIDQQNFDLYFEEAEKELHKNKFAQRIVINKIISDYELKKKNINETIQLLKNYIKSHSAVIAFYMFLGEIYRLHAKIFEAEQCLERITGYNHSPEAITIKENLIDILKTENRIIDFKISSNIDQFIIVSNSEDNSNEHVSQIKPPERRYSIRPKIPRKSGLTESSDEDSKEESGRSSKFQKKDGEKAETVKKKIHQRVAFEEKENFKPPNRPPPQLEPQEMKTPKNKNSKISMAHKTPMTVSKSYRRSDEQKITIDRKDFLILDKLGQGGFSKVYKCRDSTSGEFRALKYVNLAIIDPSSKESIKNEIEHLKNLRNERNIIEMYNYEITDEKLFIVLEYGELDVEKYLRINKGFISVETMKSFWNQMVNAVAVVHSKGIIHRDLKPCNFMICQGSLKLIDFGIANEISNDITSLTTDMVGTINYMSPEQLQETDEGSKSAKVGKWADSWSLGCILYRMAYGKLPFQEFKNNIMKISKIMDPKHQIDFPKHDCLGLVAILKICLDRNPKSRLLPEQILSSFFFNNKLDELIKYLDDSQFQEVYQAVKRLI